MTEEGIYSIPVYTRRSAKVKFHRNLDKGCSQDSPATPLSASIQTSFPPRSCPAFGLDPANLREGSRGPQ